MKFRCIMLLTVISAASCSDGAKLENTNSANTANSKGHSRGAIEGHPKLLSKTQSTAVQDLRRIGGKVTIAIVKDGTWRDDSTGLRTYGRKKVVTSVDLSGLRISNASLLLLREFNEMQSLSLSETAISDVGLRHLTHLKKLGVIRLARTKVTEEGVQFLKNELPNCEFHR